MATKVSIERAEQTFVEFGKALNRPLRDVLDQGARLMAIEFAKTSQPFGTGNEAKQKGEKAVASDIFKVYARAGDAYADISSERAKGAFWYNFKHGRFEVAQRILNDSGNRLSGLPIRHFDGGIAHHIARNATTGRVGSGTPKMIVIDERSLFRYIEKKQKDVGTGKGGWADVARQISGSIRGLKTEGDITANWITRKGKGSGQVLRSGTDEHPFITITSRIPYATQILNGTALARSKSIARFRMIENLRIALQQSARAARRAA